MESCLATLSTMDSKAYKKFLQDKLKATPKVGRLSVASLGDGDEDGTAARDEGEEGRIRV